MSSQGPASGTASATGATGCYGNTQNSQIAPGYTFTRASIRDASDWLAYKKQALIFQESKSKINQDPWFSRGNDYRLQYLFGRHKVNDGPVGCAGCASDSFGGTGPY